MLNVLSWSSLCLSILKGHLKIEQLNNARYWFGCSKLHVVREDSLVPHEAIWANRLLTNRYDRLEDNFYAVVSIDLVDEDRRELLQKLLEVIRIADTQNRVSYKCRMIETIEQLPNDSILFYDGRIVSVGDLKSE